MIVIDVDMNTMMRINKGSTGRYFYTEIRGKETRIYTEMNGMMFRFIYEWQDDQNDILFYERYLSSALRVQSIKILGEEQWQKAFMGIYEKLDEIKELMVRINGNVGRQD